MDLKKELSGCKIICITGQMAAGKNYISSQLEKEGWLSTDLDFTAHRAIEECREEILTAFSGEAENSGLLIKNSDGTINRRNLGKLLFKNPALLARQESIIYPKITEITKDFISRNQDKKIIINATLLYKTPELLELCQAVLFVTAPFITRILRSRRRDRLPLIQILRRFRSQKDLLKNYRSGKKRVIIVRNP